LISQNIQLTQNEINEIFASEKALKLFNDYIFFFFLIETEKKVEKKKKEEKKICSLKNLETSLSLVVFYID
jgi:hypothetical protein